MEKKRAVTIAEAQAQTLTLPTFEGWRTFAGLMDGYKIADELGLDFHAWVIEEQKRWRETGRWDLDVLHLRLMLFQAFRSDYMTGWDYTEHDDIADSLLRALSEQLGQPYP